MTTFDPPADNRAFNPYQAPEATLEPPVSSGDEEIRRELLKHEAAVRSIGVLYYLSGFALLAVGSIALVGTLADGVEGMMLSILFAGFALVLGGCYLAVAHGVRRLEKWVKAPILFISGLSLISFPIGTLLHGYILYLVFCESGNRVLSADYQRIRTGTPHINPKMSPLVILFVTLMLGLIGMTVLAVVLGG